MCNTCKILEWDSSFFSMKIASISMLEWNADFLSRSLIEYKKKGVDLVYLFIYEETNEVDAILSGYHSHLVDCRRVYVCENIKGKRLDSNISLYRGKASVLYDLGIQAGVNSRYRMDPDFSEVEFERLYKTWIDESIKGNMADYVLVYNGDSSFPVGLITLRKKKDCISIGLVASDQSFRRRGIGTALMDSAKYYAYVEKLPLEVVTQAHNLAACSFYEKEAFIQKSQSVVYHIWLKK